MTKLLEEAIAKVRELPEDEQDVVVEAMLCAIHQAEPGHRLTPEQVSEVNTSERACRTAPGALPPMRR